MKPPFEIYLDGMCIADADGHICTAENPEIAEEILKALNAAYPLRVVPSERICG